MILDQLLRSYCQSTIITNVVTCHISGDYTQDHNIMIKMMDIILMTNVALLRFYITT